MDSKLRALRRAIVDTETAARYVAASVQAGENTRERVLAAAGMGNEVAMLLEPDVEIYKLLALEDAFTLLTQEELNEATHLYKPFRIFDANSNKVSNLFFHERHYRGRNTQTELNWQCENVSAILLKLPEV